MALKNWRQ